MSPSFGIAHDLSLEKELLGAMAALDAKLAEMVRLRHSLCCGLERWRSALQREDQRAVAGVIRTLRRQHRRWSYQIVYDSLVAVARQRLELGPVPGYATPVHHGSFLASV